MPTRTVTLFVAVLLLSAAAASAQARNEIAFPDIPGFQTLKCDFHVHTVFSDGSVWPTVRVDEAWRLGLDAVAITDHVEYQPHRDDIPTQHERPNALAAARARRFDILLPKGAEITRDTPPGHFNAIFLESVTPLDTKDLQEAMRRSDEQGAFVFWNHHDWKGPRLGDWLEVHTTLLQKGWLHGMEVANGESYYPRAHRWCLEKKLTLVGNSDLHGPDLAQALTSPAHRTMTLVFAREKTLQSLKDALLRGRTAVWWKEKLIGRSEWLESLFHASVQIDPPHERSGKKMFAKVHNRCVADLRLTRVSGPGPARLRFPGCTTTLLELPDPSGNPAAPLRYVVDNFLVEPGRGLTVELPLQR